nr:universal stress protein [uncultured Pseudacidovorax sp.]
MDEAAQLARLAGATVVLLHVVDAMAHVTGFEPPLVHIQEVRPTFLRNGQALLDAARQTLEAQGIAAETVLLESRGERVSQLIADQASQRGCNLIVLGPMAAAAWTACCWAATPSRWPALQQCR